MAGPRLRGYTVDGLLGSGGSGEVWRARVAATGDVVALKSIRVVDVAHRRRAEAEAALLAALDHTNLVRMHALLATDDAVVLVLDLAEGGSLAELLQARGRLSAGEVVGALAPIAAALAYLHDHGVVHGDVSAGNVLFSGAGVPLLSDVGVARLTGDTADVGATPAYVDPEVAAGALPGPPSDVFMLGGVALHALTGAPPWDAPSGDLALSLAASAERPDFAGRLAAAGVPVPLSRAVRRALEADPRRRGTAADLALDLAHGAAAVAVELRAGRSLPVPQPAGRAGPRHAAQPGRPQFGRPAGEPARFAEPARPGGPPPTRLMAPRPRPVLPRAGRRRRPARRTVLACSLLLAAALAGGAAWSRAAGDPAQRAPARQPDWTGTLATLDGQRAHAFATRDPALLAQVYLSGALLSADRLLLGRIVPPGCGLVGAQTRFAQVAASARSANRVTLTTTATLAPSQLICAGRLRGTAAGAGPTRLRVRLVQTPAGWRIAEQAQVS